MEVEGIRFDVRTVRQEAWKDLVALSLWNAEGRKDGNRRSDMQSDYEAWDYFYMLKFHGALSDQSKVHYQAMATGSFRSYKKLYASKLKKEPTCDLCGEAEGDTLHLVWNCPHFREMR